MNLDFETVRLALANLTVVQPTGLLYGGQQAVALQTNDQLMTAQGFDDAIVAYHRRSQASPSEEQLAQFAKIVEAGPDREKDGVVRWRRVVSGARILPTCDI